MPTVAGCSRTLPGDQVFVIKPSGWALPTRDNGLPQLALDPVRPGGLDCHLIRADEPTQFDVALLADTQPQSMRELDYLRDTILASVVSSGCTVAINHGDVVFDVLDLYPRYLDLIAATGLTWHHCPGNHDMDHADDPAQSFATWQRVFGPCHYAFQHGGVTFIMLNNVERLPDRQLTASGYDYRGAIGKRQLDFVRNLLVHVPREQLVVISMHIPLVGEDDPIDPAGMTHDRAELLRLLSERPNTLSLAGHTHTTEHHYLGPEHGFLGPGLHHHHVLTAACGSWWSGPFDNCGLPFSDSRDGTPKGYHVLSIDGQRYTTRFVPVGSVASQLRISLEGCSHDEGRGLEGKPRERLNPIVTGDQLASTRIIVNVFDGGPRTTVRCRIVGNNRSTGSTVHRLELARRKIADPFTVESYCRHRAEIKSWVEPSLSSHIWQAQVPPDLAPGSYRIEVECSDEYGRKHLAAILVEVTA